MRKNISWLFGLSALLLAACGAGGPSVEGTWVQPVPGMENLEQGFTLAEDGRAASVNMATLQYESWEKHGEALILSGKSIGNHQTIAFSDTLPIVRLTADSLILSNGISTLSYSRKK